jgi:hypothetical protein
MGHNHVAQAPPPNLNQVISKSDHIIATACDDLEQVTPLLEALYPTLAKGQRLT